MAHLKKLVLLHSNDMHGDFLAEHVDEHLIGGVSMLSGYIDKVRREEANTLYCVAGDMFRGSVIDSEFKGFSTIEIMNALAPDVVTLGNHETDYGVAHLLFLEKCAKFPIINANLYIRTNFVRLFRPYIILNVNGMKILFIGILTEDVLSQTKSDGMIGSFIDIHEAAEEVGRICNAHNALDIDFTVLLTHIGFEEDKRLAAQLDPAWGVDVIIGGHSHTLPEHPALVNGVLIVQAGTGTDQIGRFDLMIDTDHNCVDSYTWCTVPVTSANCPNDPEMEKLLNMYKSSTDRKYNRTVTRLLRPLTHPCRTQETELGNLFADIFRDSLHVDLMMVGSGSIRSEKLGPLVLYSDLTECYPYDSTIHLLVVTGEQLRHMLQHILRSEVWSGAHCEFYQYSSGFYVECERATGQIRRLELNGEPIEDTREYTLGLEKFHFLNFSENMDLPLEQITAAHKSRIIATSSLEILDEYLTDHMLLDRKIEGRITVV